MNAVGNSQHCFQAFQIGPNPGSSEDCLYLDIYIPRTIYESGTENVPMYVYFHGGAYMIGMNTAISGGHIASTQNIIVIAANYRLGVFGFWFHPTFEARMDAEHNLEYNEELPSSGNQALLDNQMAMIWTREYGPSLGGNPDLIAIGGMSAGGQIINAHAVMQSSESLFHRMISYSGPNGIPYYNDTEATFIYEQIAGNLECCNLPSIGWGTCNGGVNRDCIINKTAQEIMEQAWAIRQYLTIDPQRLTMLAEPFHPTWNTAVLERMPYFHFIDGEIHDKPFYIDTADNEGWGFIPMVFWGIGGNGTQVQDHRWQQLLEFLFQDDFGRVMEHYACPCPECECHPVADEFLTDFTWYCNMR